MDFLLCYAAQDAIIAEKRKMGSTARFGKQIRREIFRQVKIWKAQEYFVYFALFKPQNWRKRSAEARGRNCAVLPMILDVYLREVWNLGNCP